MFPAQLCFPLCEAPWAFVPLDAYLKGCFAAIVSDSAMGHPGVIHLVVPTALVIVKGEPLRANWSHLSLSWWKIALIMTARKIFSSLQFLMWPIPMILQSSALDGLSFFTWRNSEQSESLMFLFRWGLIYFFLKKWGMTFKHLRSCSLFQLCCSIVMDSCGMKLRD